MRTISVKVPEELADRIEATREKDGEGKEPVSTVVRRLIRAGLDAEDRDPHAVSFPMFLLWVGSVFVAIQYASATGAVGPMGIAAVVAGILLMNERIRSKAVALHARFTGEEGLSDGSRETENTGP